MPTTSMRTAPTALRRLLGLVLILGMGALGIGCGDSGESAAQHLDVKSFRYVQQPNGDLEFTGEVHNTGSSRVAVAQVEVSLFNETGTQVGTQHIEVEDIPAGGAKGFTQGLTHDQAVSQARVKSIMAP